MCWVVESDWRFPSVLTVFVLMAFVPNPFVRTVFVPAEVAALLPSVVQVPVASAALPGLLKWMRFVLCDWLWLGLGSLFVICRWLVGQRQALMKDFQWLAHADRSFLGVDEVQILSLKSFARAAGSALGVDVVPILSLLPTAERLFVCKRQTICLEKMHLSIH